MTIKEIYTKYKIHPNLQEHMLRVAGLARNIIDNWKGAPPNKQVVLHACFFHDAAKLIKFKYFKEDEEHWKQVQQEMIEKYGDEDHEATIKICEEVGVSPQAINLLGNKNVRPYIDRVRKIASSDDFGLKIVQYCDARTAPDGLTSLDDRYKELMQRDSSKKMDDDAQASMNLLYEIEKQIQANTQLDLQGITRENIMAVAKELESYQL